MTSSSSRRSSILSQNATRRPTGTSTAPQRVLDANSTVLDKVLDRVLDHPFYADDPSTVPRRPRSRPRPGPGLGAALLDKPPAPSYQCLGDHRFYAPADDPAYERPNGLRPAVRLRSAPPSTRPSARLHATTPQRSTKAKIKTNTEEN